MIYSIIFYSKELTCLKATDPLVGFNRHVLSVSPKQHHYFINIYLKSACHDEQNGNQSFNLRARIGELWQLKAHKVEKVYEEDHLAFFKPGLWQTGFFGCGKNGTIFSRI